MGKKKKDKKEKKVRKDRPVKLDKATLKAIQNAADKAVAKALKKARQEPDPPAAPAPLPAVTQPVVDHSANYNAEDGVRRMRQLTSIDAVLSFTAGESRSTITRAIPGVLRRLEKERAEG